MKKIFTTTLSILFFFGSFQGIFADQCLNSNIAAYFLDNKNTDDESENEEFNKKNKDLVVFISNQRQVFLNNISGKKGDELDDIEKINENFIDLQDEKFELSIKYVIKKFLQENDDSYKDELSGEGSYKNILDVYKKGAKKDFFIEEYLGEKKYKFEIIKNIPTSVLQNSVYLDFLIFSCELGNLKNGYEFQAGGLIKDLMSESDSIDFEKNEILEKQQIVVERAISRYQSFLTNREMYIALRGVIEKLEHLKRRFEDFARLIGFLPAKLVDFGYQAK